jgi:non-ribosomal peptide synthetase-like protein
VVAVLSAVVGSLTVFLLGAIVGGVLLTALVARLAGAIIVTGKPYPLYGVHYAIASLGVWISNSTFYNIVFGDSSFIVHYLRLIGFDLSVVRQTGSNFGSHQLFDLPTACRVGSGTMISDALTMISIRQSDTSFVVERAVIGADTFFGNRVIYIAGARAGDGNLFATKVLIPLHGPVRENVGLLGSPPFEIPRTVVTQRSFDPFADTPERRRQLAAKNRHNLVTLVWYLLLIWGSTLVTFALAVAAYEAHHQFGWGALLAWAVVAPAVSVAYFLAMERLGPGRMRLEPRTCTIHAPHYARIERYWKMGETPLKVAFKGTPFRPWIYRMLGVKAGRMVFDDGCHITEKGLTEIGDHCCLNEGSALQAHSLEDGLFKSDRITLGQGCTLGVGAFVNYAVQMGDDATLESDAFLMKGSTVGPGERWSGNPARRREAARPRAEPVDRDANPMNVR